MKALVIIPAYNEEGAIVNTVKNLKSICPDVDYVIIVRYYLKIRMCFEKCIIR